jgi:hypothetical protein
MELLLLANKRENLLLFESASREKGFLFESVGREKFKVQTGRSDSSFKV